MKKLEDIKSLSDIDVGEGLSFLFEKAKEGLIEAIVLTIPLIIIALSYSNVPYAVSFVLMTIVYGLFFSKVGVLRSAFLYAFLLLIEYIKFKTGNINAIQFTDISDTYSLMIYFILAAGGLFAQNIFKKQIAYYKKCHTIHQIIIGVICSALLGLYLIIPFNFASNPWYVGQLIGFGSTILIMVILIIDKHLFPPKEKSNQ